MSHSEYTDIKLQAHLINPLCDKPKIFFINLSETAHIKIIFYETNSNETPNLHILPIHKLNNQITLCNYYSTYNLL